MKGMPLILAADRPLLGPMVPVIGRTKVVRTEGMKPGDTVQITGHNDTESKVLLSIEDENATVTMILHAWDYLQAERFGRGNAVHVWLEDPHGH